MFFPSPFAQPRSSFEEPVIPPSVDPDEGGFVSVSFNADWLPYVLGALTQLQQPTTWDGDDAAKSLAVDRAILLSNMISYPIATPPGVTPTPPVLTRYNPTLHRVESSFDGGTTWAANPALDPQKTTYLPPQTGTNAACNSAASEIAWLVRWSELLTTTIAPATTATALAYAQIALFTELAWPYSIIVDVFITASIGLLDAGITAIGNALLSANLDILLCIINCNLNSLNQLTEDSFAAVQEQVTSQIGGTDATIINLMLSLQGAGGINDAMALALATDDCSGCSACEWCYDFSAAGTLGTWSLFTNGRGTFSGGIWHSVHDAPNITEDTQIYTTWPAANVKEVQVTFSNNKNDGNRPTVILYNAGVQVFRVDFTHATNSVQSHETDVATMNVIADAMQVANIGKNLTGTNTVENVVLSGDGNNPFGSNNC